MERYTASIFLALGSIMCLFAANYSANSNSINLSIWGAALIIISAEGI